MSAVKKIKYKTMTQLVVEAIREKILSGEIKAGEQIRQASLAEELSVSLIPVREALRLLESEGIVTFEANKGVSATEFNLDQLDEIFELRGLLEVELLIASLPNTTTEKLEEARGILNQLDSISEYDNPPKAWCDLNAAYHSCLYSAANRPQTQLLVNHLNKKSERYVRMHLNWSKGINKVYHEHNNILTSCISGNIDKAVTSLKQHILDSRDEIKTCLLRAC